MLHRKKFYSYFLINLIYRCEYLKITMWRTIVNAIRDTRNERIDYRKFQLNFD